MAKKLVHTEISQSAPVALNAVNNIKAIKNSLFKDADVGSTFIIAGTIRGLGDKSGTFGDYTQFTGDFVCKVGDEVTRAGLLYLPTVASNALKNQFLEVVEGMDALDAAARKKANIQFKILLEKTADEKSSAGYVWTFKNLVDTQAEPDKVLALLG